MNDDERCCGSGHCLLNPEGRCWCGQQWDGEKMTTPTATQPASPVNASPAPGQHPEP